MKRRDIENKQGAENEQGERAPSPGSNLIACIAADGTTRYVNAAISAISGHSPEELQGRNFWSTLVPGNKCGEIEQLLARARAGTLAEQRLTAVTRDGASEQLAVTIAARHMPAGSAIEYILVGTKIADRSETDRSQPYGDERLQRIAANIPGIVFEYRLRPDRGAAFEYVSDRALELLEESPQDLARDPHLIFALVEPAFRRRLLRSMLASRDDLSLWTAELPIRTRSGRVIWVRGQSMPQRLADGSVRWDGVIIDVSAQKQAELAIQTLNEQLERRVADRTAELTAANRELQSFAYSVSHDLRAPLRSIDGFSRALLEDHAEQLDARAAELLTRVRNAAERMSELIDALLSLSRVTRGELNRVHADMSQLANSIIAELRGDSQRRVDVHIEPGITCFADPSLLRIALHNLLANAWKFSSKRQHARIELGTLLQADKTVYYVRDNGAGFDMKYAGKLFGAFQRVHSIREFEGTGIGLATVRRIIDRHGGAVWAQAEVNQGATFYFTLAGSEERQ